MDHDEALNAALHRHSAQMNTPVVLDQRRARREAGRILDADTAEVICLYVETADPYGFCVEVPAEVSRIARGYFARADGGEVWTAFNDLPEATMERLLQRINAGEFDAAEQERSCIAPLRFGQVRAEVQRALHAHFGPIAIAIDECHQLPDGRFRLLIREDCSCADTPRAPHSVHTRGNDYLETTP